mmetsp:Transcript_95507/g.270396  ORF Transcript_95507/g.270396 Transcript_95507/m.270396 type:complete len:155 (+) Transcript_95507:50-514(+)
MGPVQESAGGGSRTSPHARANCSGKAAGSGRRPPHLQPAIGEDDPCLNPSHAPLVIRTVERLVGDSGAGTKAKGIGAGLSADGDLRGDAGAPPGGATEKACGDRAPEPRGRLCGDAGFGDARPMGAMPVAPTGRVARWPSGGDSRGATAWTTAV